MNYKVLLITLFVLIAVLIIGFIVVKRLFFPYYNTDVVLADDFLITTEWKNIDTQESVYVSKDRQFICIGVESPLQAFSADGGIKLPSGEILNPEIKLVDTDGVEYSLTYSGARRYDYDFANYQYKPGLPRGLKFSKILLRSDVPIPTKRIQWSEYDIKDLP